MYQEGYSFKMLSQNPPKHSVGKNPVESDSDLEFDIASTGNKTNGSFRSHQVK